MPTRLEANDEEIAKVREVLERSAPQERMTEGIEGETGYPNYIIHSAIRALRRQGVNVEGRYPFKYDPEA